MLAVVLLIMVADASSLPPAEHLRQQLISEPKHEKRSDYGGVPPLPSNKPDEPIVRKPRNREITSRYKLVSQGAQGSNHRCYSPDFGRSSHPLELPKRAVSVDRKHPSTPLNLDSKSSAPLPKSGRKVSKQLWPPENLSASKQTNFTSNSSQEEDSSLKAVNGIQASTCLDGMSHQKAVAAVSGALPFRCNRTDQSENLRPAGTFHNKHEASWGEIGKNPRSGSNALSRSVDFCIERQRSGGDAKTSSSLLRPNNSSSGNASARVLARTRNDFALSQVKESSASDSIYDRAKSSGAIHKAESIQGDDFGHVRADFDDGETASYEPFLPFLSRDSEAPSSVTGESVRSSKARDSKAACRGTIVPARFWQDQGSRLRRFSEGEFTGTLSASEGEPSKGSRRSKAASPGPATAPSPPLSPSDLSKSMQFLTSMKELPNLPKQKAFQNGRHMIQSVASGIVLDSRKGKRNPNQQEDAHCLRILQNRLLQWRFVNAQAEFANASQQGAAENQQYNVWLQSFEMRTSVVEKRIQLQQAKLSMKIESVISCHSVLLQVWETLYQDHATALAEVLTGLEASVLRLPLTRGAKAEIQNLQEVLNFAALLMNDASSSIEFLQMKAESMAAFLSELAEITVQERSFLEESGDLFHLLAALEVEERSLRTYFVQLQYDQNKSAGKRHGNMCTALV